MHFWVWDRVHRCTFGFGTEFIDALLGLGPSSSMHFWVWNRVHWCTFGFQTEFIDALLCPEDQVRLKTGSEVIHNSEVNINLLGKSCLTSEKVNWSNNLKSIHANSLRFCSIACGNTWFFLHVTGSKIEHLQFFEMFFWVFLCLHESLKLYLTSSFGRKTSWIYMALQLSCFWSFLQEPSFYRSFASVLELPLSNLIHLYLAQNVSLESKKQYESKHSLSNNSQITLCCVFLLPTNSQLTLKAKLSAQPQE